MKIPAFTSDGSGHVVTIEIDEPTDVREERERLDWLKLVRERYRLMQDQVDVARDAFLLLKSSHESLLAWARTKGYPG